MTRETRRDIEVRFRELMEVLDAPYNERDLYNFLEDDGERVGYCLDYLRGSGWSLMVAMPAGRSGTVEFLVTQAGMASGRLGIKAFSGALNLLIKMHEAERKRQRAIKVRQDAVLLEAARETGWVRHGG